MLLEGNLVMSTKQEILSAMECADDIWREANSKADTAKDYRDSCRFMSRRWFIANTYLKLSVVACNIALHAYMDEEFRLDAYNAQS